jgi:transposase
MASQKPVFKTYSQNQILLLPPSLDELIGKDHPVRIVNEVINSVDIQSLVGAYASKGT